MGHRHRRQAVADRAVPALKKTLSFFFRSSRSRPLTLFSLQMKRCSQSLHLTIDRIKSVADCENFRKRSLAFSSVLAWSATAWLPVNCACVPQLFEQLTNTMLCPAFLRKFACQPLRCIPLQIQTFYQNLVVVA